MNLKVLNVIGNFGSAMYSFIAFISRMECQASRISLCRQPAPMSTISTTLQIYLMIVKRMVFGQQRVWPLRIQSYIRVFSARDV